MDVFVFPSIDEGLGIALIEAMATGLPSVVSDEGGIPEIVTNRETGLIVNAGDSMDLCEGIAKVFGDSEMRARLGAAACDRAIDDHRPSVYCKKLLKLHDQLLSAADTASDTILPQGSQPVANPVPGSME